MIQSVFKKEDWVQRTNFNWCDFVETWFLTNSCTAMMIWTRLKIFIEKTCSKTGIFQAQWNTEYARYCFNVHIKLKRFLTVFVIISLSITKKAVNLLRILLTKSFRNVFDSMKRHLSSKALYEALSASFVFT